MRAAARAALQVHGCCGCWACIATALFSVPAYSYGAGAGLFFGHGKQLGATVVCLLAEIAWTSLLAASMFLALKRRRRGRIDVGPRGGLRGGRQRMPPSGRS